MLSRQYFFVFGLAAIALGALFFFQPESATGFAVFTEKIGSNFAMTISGDSAYSFSFKNLNNYSIYNATAKLIFPAGANLSNYGSGLVNSSADSVLLFWKFDSIAGGVNSSLTFSADAEPTQMDLNAVDENSTSLSDTSLILKITTTTTAETTTTIGNATTTTVESTTTTTIPFDYDEAGGADAYSSKFQKSRKDKDNKNDLPEGWYIKKDLDLKNEDDTETYSAYVDVDNKKAIKIFGITTDDTRFYSEPITWGGGKIKVKVLYKPIGNETCEVSAVFGFEVLFSDESGDTTLGFTADNAGNASGGNENSKDFDVSSKKEKDGWHQISAKSDLEIESGKNLRFFVSQPSDKCGSGFYISELSIK